MVKIKLLKTIDEIIEFTDVFNKSIGYSNVPWQYHATGKCYALIENDKIIAGFCLIPGFFNLRSILQMPKESIKQFYNSRPDIAKNMCDLTAYFINNPKYGIKFTLFLTFICLLYSKKYFIYTYPVHDLALKKYYGKGDPMLIYTGIPLKLPGHSDNMESENIEVLSKLGIIKILLYRTTRFIKLRGLK